MSSIRETVLTLSAVEWLDKRISETNRAIGVGPPGRDEETGKILHGAPVFDKRCKIYRALRCLLLDDNPEVQEIREALSYAGPRDKKITIEDWLAKNS